MEFVHGSEVMGLLEAHGVVPTPGDEDRVYLRMTGPNSADVVRIHLTTAAATTVPEEGARTISVEPEQIPDAIEGVIHKLHLNEILLVPVSTWRHVFDAVAFSLADNEDWQAVDTAATVELNSRDPLLCEPSDFHTVSALVRALLDDADRPEQGLMLASTGAPVLVELIPDGAARMSFGNRVLADEVSEAWNVGST